LFRVSTLPGRQPLRNRPIEGDLRFGSKPMPVAHIFHQSNPQPLTAQQKHSPDSPVVGDDPISRAVVK
jgi:hypothetical protein